MMRITAAARSVTDAIRTSADRHMRLVLALLAAAHLGLVVLDLAGRAAPIHGDYDAKHDRED